MESMHPASRNQRPDDHTTPAKPQPAIRLGLRMVRGLPEDCAQRIVEARRDRPFRDVDDLVRRAGLDRFERERLAEAGALRSLAGHRHRAFWAVAAADSDDRATRAARKPASSGPAVVGDLLDEARIAEARVALRPPSAADDVFADYATQGLSLARHPLALVRRQLAARRVQRASDLLALQHGSRVRCAGLVTQRQRPATASGVTFLTLEDESGLVNVVVWRDLALRQRRELVDATVLGVEGVLETVDGVRHLIARRLHDYSDLLTGLDARSRDFH